MPSTDELRKRAETEAARISTRLARSVASTRDNRSLSKEGQRAMIAAQWVNANREVARHRDAVTKSTKDEIRRLRERELGPGDLPMGSIPADKVAIASSFRDAYTRASASDKREERLALLEQAEVSGDTLLARAVVTVGFERNELPVVNRYIESHPGAERGLQRLYDLAGPASLKGDLSTEMLFSLDRPAELNGLTDTEINTLAGPQPVPV